MTRPELTPQVSCATMPRRAMESLGSTAARAGGTMASVGEQADLKNRDAPARVPPVPTPPFTTPGDYFQQLLRLIQPVLKPVSSAVWRLDENGVFTKVAELSAAP